MYNLLKAEIYKLKHSKELLICAIVLIILGGIGVYFGNQCGRSSFASQGREMFALMACTLFAITNVGKDLSFKTINHALTSGNTRRMVLMSKYISYIIACIIILLINYMVMGGLNTIFYGWGEVFNSREGYFIIVYIVTGIFFDLCLVSIPFFICMVVETSSLALTLSAGVMGLILVLSQLPWETVSYTVASKDSSLGVVPFIFTVGFMAGTILLYLLCSFYFNKKDIH